MKLTNDIAADAGLQRGLKYTDHKLFGRHYLGVTRTTNEPRNSHPHTLFSEQGPKKIMATDPLFLLR